MKFRRNNHKAWDSNAALRARTLPLPGNTDQKLVQKKRRFDKGQLKIMDLGSEEDAGNK